MKKIFLAFAIFVGIANATDVAVCQFKYSFGFADDKVICSGGNTSTTTIQDLYSEGWSFKGSYNIKESTYIVMEKGNK